MHLSLFPPSFQVQNATIGEDPRFSTGRPFAAAEQLSVSVKFWPLLHKQLEVNSLTLTRPHIELVRDSQGAWNFATLGQQPGQQPAPAPSPQAAKKGSAQQPAKQPAPQPQTAQQPSPQPAGKTPAGQLSLANLSITDGQVAITD